MKKIHFKNGSTLEVNDRIANTIVKDLQEGGYKFLYFGDKDDNLILIINTEEIVYIK